MKKFTLLFLFMLMTLSTQCQNFFRHKVDIKKYEVIDSLPIERISIYSPFDYEDDKIIALGGGDYLIEAPHKDKMIIATTKNRKRAIVLYNSYAFGRHKEFYVKEDERRIILYYDDNTLYCGYIYDKVFKVCKYFESIQW